MTLPAVMYQAGTGFGGPALASAVAAASAQSPARMSTTAVLAAARPRYWAPRRSRLISPAEPATPPYCDKGEPVLPTGPWGTCTGTRLGRGWRYRAGAGGPAPAAC